MFNENENSYYAIEVDEEIGIIKVILSNMGNVEGSHGRIELFKMNNTIIGANATIEMAEITLVTSSGDIFTINLAESIKFHPLSLF
ncbi:hypothetical protein VQL36_20500 [Chengkuizengella sp. SCS-71B]|uniref:hypothetical protein n=1 Tax=Chengkuizengella sp. SCS-71B TaxID=3115290 RepID=UPI0032C21E6C